jgi:hypothetical protein
MKDKRMPCPYFSEWEPTGEGCNTVAAYETIEKGKYYG